VKTKIASILALTFCALSLPAQSGKHSTTLPTHLVGLILKDRYSGKLPPRVQTPIEKWPFHSLDLNDDGKPDYIIERVDPEFCGSGGCGILIYASSPSGYRSVYSGGEFYSPCQALKFKTNGFHDLSFKYIHRTGRFYFVGLWFDGHEYQKQSSGYNKE
jgi:hypothetical protein